MKWTFNKPYNSIFLADELESAGIKVSGANQVCSISGYDTTLIVEGDLTPAQWVVVEQVINNHKLPTNEQIVAKAKDNKLKDSFRTAVIAVLEEILAEIAIASTGVVIPSVVKGKVYDRIKSKL